ncbi:MAG: DUF2189 domain-containing protein, partial [Henriciella sp.]
RLPDIRRVGLDAPLRWLALGWADFRRAPICAIAYGIGLAAASYVIAGVLYFTGKFTWFLVLAGGFLIVAPILGLGLYRAADLLSRGARPTLRDMLLPPGALRGDLVILGVALFILFGIWAEAAYIIYGLSTSATHANVIEFLGFMILTPEGLQMAAIGTLVGGAIAFIAFSLVVVSAPMLLARENDVFIALITSVRSVIVNGPAMLFWAFLIAGLTMAGIGLALLGLVVVFPWIGFASWHAYKELVIHHPGAAARQG